MDPYQNPYTPGAGAQPPELAGRDALLKKASIALHRIALGRFSRGLIITGLRGVGKTVLLNRIRQEAESAAMMTIRIEAMEERSLPSLLESGIRSVLTKLDQDKTAATLVKRGFTALAHFVSAMKLKYGDLELGIDLKSKNEIKKTSLDENLTELFCTIGTIAKEKKTAIILFIDELQTLNEHELSALIRALHMVAQDTLPLAMVAAGLPQIPSKMGKAKTYAERLFEFLTVGSLEHADALDALVVPAKKLGVHYSKTALNEILTQTQGYAYFLQEWGKNAWDIAKKSPITEQNAKQATKQALCDLDESFFRVRFDQLTPVQKHYLHVMAQLGPGPHSSGDIADKFGKKVTELAPVREKLIHKGLIYSPAFGQTAFTVPLFDDFMKRMML